MSDLTMRDRLLLVADLWCAATERSRSRLSTLLFSNGRRLDAIAEGGDLTTRSFERAMEWLSSEWLPDFPWPSDVPRPAAPEAGLAGSAPGSTPTREPATTSGGAP